MFVIRILRLLIIKTKLFFADSMRTPKILSNYYGFKIGNSVRFTGKIHFGSEPYLIEFGNNVTVTPGVKFQTHDGGVTLFRKEYPGMNVYGRIKIGNNVFLGQDAMIMYGVTIGDNVVIGARSVVTKDIPSNSVAVGVPAKVIKSLEEYKTSSLKKAMFILEKDPNKREIEIRSKFI